MTEREKRLLDLLYTAFVCIKADVKAAESKGILMPATEIYLAEIKAELEAK
jgi:hypothetical protein